MRKKISLNKKHYQLGNHFKQFIDTRWHPNFIITDDVLEIFIHFQSYGKSQLTESELKLIEPLIYAQQLKEIQIKSLVEDIGFFWKNGFGWYIPLMADIKAEFKARHLTKDTLYLKALIKMARNIHENGIVNFISNFTGHSQEWKNKTFEQYIKNNTK